MNITVSPKAEKQLSKLPQHIQKKTHRQLPYCLRRSHSHIITR